MKLTPKDQLAILENALTYIVVFAMLAYGVGKLVQFKDAVPTTKMISELTAQQVMWAFYGYSKPFVYVLGTVEIFCAALLFFKRTRLLGCVLVSTILINVILQDIFYSVNIGALKAAIIYQGLIIFILLINRSKVVAAFKSLTSFHKVDQNKSLVFVKFILSVFLFVVLRIVEYYVTIKW